MTDETSTATKPPTPRRLPWELHPAPTEEQLTAAARLLARGRADAVAFADPWAGDDAWSIGCRAYAFSKHQFSRAAESGRYDWLGVLDETHHFVFLMRTCRSASIEATLRSHRSGRCASRRARSRNSPWLWGVTAPRV